MGNQMRRLDIELKKTEHDFKRLKLPVLEQKLNTLKLVKVEVDKHLTAPLANTGRHRK